MRQLDMEHHHYASIMLGIHSSNFKLVLLHTRIHIKAYIEYSAGKWENFRTKNRQLQLGSILYYTEVENDPCSNDVFIIN